MFLAKEQPGKKCHTWVCKVGYPGKKFQTQLLNANKAEPASTQAKENCISASGRDVMIITSTSLSDFLSFFAN
jgi:hypothetical protein